MKVTVYGTRGSVPVPEKEFLEYGGNTSCYLLECDEHIIVDAGTGIIKLGAYLKEDMLPIHIFISHVHLDHIHGLYDFAPFYQQGREIHIYGERREGESIADQLKSIVRPPYWPVGFDDYSANVIFHDIEVDKKYDICSKMSFIAHRSNHPNVCTNYRFEQAGKTFVYVLDYEHIPELLDDIVEFCNEADLVVFDAAYVPGKIVKNFGHSSWEEGLLIADKAHVKKIAMSHYSRHYSDDVLREQERLMQQVNPNAVFAKENMVIEM